MPYFSQEAGIMRKAKVLSLALILLILGYQTNAKDLQKKALPPNIDLIVSRAMKTFEVPGLSLAIVKDGKVLLAKGYGVRNLKENIPVDSKTLFSIASNSKLFTAVSLGILVDEGKISWNSRVVDLIPWFQMFDPYVTREITVKDILSHRCGLGLGAGDLLWWPPSNYPRDEIIKRIRFIPPSSSFRSSYAYNNLMFLVAGKVVESVSGMSWEDFVFERIFKPLRIDSSSPRVSDLKKFENSATPYAKVDGVLKEVKPFLNDNINPAGGIISCAEDMARWMIVMVDGGRIDKEKRLLSEKSYREITSIVTPRPISDPPQEIVELKPNFSGYGLGIGVRDYRGTKILQHTGGLPGFLSQVTMVPSLKLGIAVLTNQESSEAYSSITYSILDYYLSAPSKDWIASFLKYKEREEKSTKEEEEKAERERKKDSKPSLPLPSYAGVYKDDWYGDVEIVWTGEKLRIKFSQTPSLVGDLEHWQYDTFIARWDDRELRADAYVTFSLNPDGTIERVRMKAFSPSTDFSFDFHDLLLKPVKKEK